MSDKIDSTLRSVADLRTGIQYFSKELDKIQFQLEELKRILNSQSTNTSSEKKEIEVVEKKPQKKIPVVVRREDQEEVEVLDSSGYQIQVVGLGVQKMD
jgi:regulator of replication initiation timing